MYVRPSLEKRSGVHRFRIPRTLIGARMVGKTCILCMVSDACKMGQSARTEPNRMMAVRVGAASLRKILGLNVNPYWD